jgi:hypothetical protein
VELASFSFQGDQPNRLKRRPSSGRPGLQVMRQVLHALVAPRRHPASFSPVLAYPGANTEHDALTFVQVRPYRTTTFLHPLFSNGNEKLWKPAESGERRTQGHVRTCGGERGDAASIRVSCSIASSA